MRIPLTAALFAGVFAAACTQSTMSPAQPDSIAIPIRAQSEPRASGLQSLGSESAYLGGAPDNHRTHLSGAEEVPARDTGAQGQAVFQVNKDGTAMSYKLMVANIENVTQAHIHLAPFGTNGGIVV